jgi:hypothetical protein
MHEILSMNVDDFYLFMPINAMNFDNQLYYIFEKIQPDRNIRLCLIGVPYMAGYKFETTVEFLPIVNKGSIFEGELL